MIRHICMFKFKEENKKQNLEEAVRRVESLRELPQVKRFEIAVNDETAPASNYELALIFDFASMAELDAYQKDPKHLEFGAFISQVREGRACIDFQI